MIGNLPYNTPQSNQFVAPQTIKNHIESAITTVTINNWTDFEGFTNVLTESNGTALSLNADLKTIDVLKKGLYQFGGCAHYQNNSAGIFSNLKILTRIFKNSTTEARCSQRGKTINFAAGGEDILTYNGTDFLEIGDKLNLQYFTTQSGLDFFSDTNFQNPVAATIWLNYLGDYT